MKTLLNQDIENKKLSMDAFDEETRQMMIDLFSYNQDFPKPGILYLGLEGYMRDAVVFKRIVDYFCRVYESRHFDAIVCIESAGYTYGSAIAYNLGLPLRLMRKAGKLPGAVTNLAYDLEYGSATLEVQLAGFEEGQKVLLFDDVLATGGTARAGADLLNKIGVDVVETAFVVEFPELGGSKVINTPLNVLLSYQKLY